jgi:16S rRNA (cytidine1402-2'-O)-methyltransferase
MGTLYVVGTPIGNLEDITLRALRILRQVDLIAAEDTRTTRKLLTLHEIKTRLTSYWEHSKLTKLQYILDTLQQEDVALVSKAGMPGISDPGYELIKAAIEAGVDVVPIPGPSAVTAALAISGLPTDGFLYLGFLPRKKRKRARLLASLLYETRTIVAFEAPHRLLNALEDIKQTLGDRSIAVTRELTKVHEEAVRGTLREVIDHFQKNAPRGELTLVVEGAAEEPWDEAMVKEALARLRAEGESGTNTVKEVAKLAHRPRSEVYRIWLSMEDE